MIHFLMILSWVCIFISITLSVLQLTGITGWLIDKCFDWETKQFDKKYGEE